MMSLRPKEINANKQTQHLRVGTKLRRDEGEVYEEGEVIKVLQGGLHYRVRWLTYEEVICSGDANDMYLYQTNFVTSFNKAQEAYGNDIILNSSKPSTAGEKATTIAADDHQEARQQQEDEEEETVKAEIEKTSFWMMRNLDRSFSDTSCESVASSNNLSLCFDDDFEDTKSVLREHLTNIDIDLLHGDALHLHEGILTHLTETARDLLVRASASPPTASFSDASCESVASSNNLSLCFDDDFEDTKSVLREHLTNIDIDLLHGDALHLHEGILTHLTETARDLLVRASASPPTASFSDASCESVDALHICEGLLTHLTKTTNLVDTLQICEVLLTHLTETNQVRASTSSTAHGTQNNKEQIEGAAAVICKEQMKDEEKTIPL